MKVLFKKYKSTPKLFEDDLDYSQENLELNSRPLPKADQMSTVPSVSPLNAPNKIQDDISVKGR